MNYLKRMGLIPALSFAMLLGTGVVLPAEDVAVLLEKAIYAEETLGNLDEAIDIYKQLAADAAAGRTTAAQALYRLGMCYRKSGNIAEAQETFVRLTQLYPEQKELIAQIPARADAPKFGAAPWADGEVLIYSAKAKGAGTGAGVTMVHAIKADAQNGKAGWKFQTNTILGTASTEVATVRMDAQYFLIEKQRKIQEFETLDHSRYFPDRVVISGALGDAAKQREFNLNRTIYDGEQSLHLLRTLPLREGYEVILPIFNTSNGSVVDMKVWVDGREKISVPAGVFDCFKVIAQAGDAKQTHWFSVDSPFYPVKHDLSNVIEALELISITKSEKNQSVDLVNTDMGLSAAVPPEWIGVSTRLMNTNILNMLDPEYETNCAVMISQASLTNEPADLSQLIDVLNHQYQAAYKEYMVRDGSRENLTVSGMPGIHFVADRKSVLGDRDITTYRVMFGKVANRIGMAEFTTSRENFERFRPTFDAIVNSILMTDKAE